MSSDLAPHALAPGTQIRDYTIVSVIGTGGFSIVYKAIDNSLDRAVAIKEYFPGSFALRDDEGSVRPHSRDSAMFSKGIESFLNEGKLLAEFDHPALVRVYRCWEERGTAYLAMRLYAGTTLRDAVKAGDWHTDVTTLPALLLPVCSALDLLHASKCYHRDVAPDNIMLVDSGSRLAPVLLDFGAARKAIESTQVFTAILKPGYAPIEQYGDGELKQGPWTDIYALAGVVYFTLAGNAPPTAITRMLKDAMPRPRDAFVGQLPEHWLDAIECALAVKLELRPQTISEFVASFGWDTVAERLTTVVLPPIHSSPPSPSRAAPTPRDAPDAAVTTLVDDRTVVVSLPQKLAPDVAISPMAGAPALVDDASTVVMLRRDLDAQIAFKKVASAAMPAAAPEPQVAAKPQIEAAPAKRRNMVWIAAAAVLLAAIALTWKLTSSQTATPSAVPGADSKVIEPTAKPMNDASVDKKTSVRVAAPSQPVIIAPETVVPEPIPALPTHATNPTNPPQKAAVTEAPTAAAPVANAKAVAKEKAKASRPSEPNADAGDDKSSARASKRPARCELLIERFQLGETPSAADQRFFQESCK